MTKFFPGGVFRRVEESNRFLHIGKADQHKPMWLPGSFDHLGRIGCSQVFTAKFPHKRWNIADIVCEECLVFDLDVDDYVSRHRLSRMARHTKLKVPRLRRTGFARLPSLGTTKVVANDKGVPQKTLQ